MPLRLSVANSRVFSALKGIVKFSISSSNIISSSVKKSSILLRETSLVYVNETSFLLRGSEKINPSKIIVRLRGQGNKIINI